MSIMGGTANMVDSTATTTTANRPPAASWLKLHICTITRTTRRRSGRVGQPAPSSCLPAYGLPTWFCSSHVHVVCEGLMAELPMPRHSCWSAGPSQMVGSGFT